MIDGRSRSAAWTAVVAVVAILASGCLKVSGSSGSGTGSSSGGRPIPTTAGLPLGSPVTQPLSTAGGRAASSDARLEVTVPAGAVAGSTTLSIQEITGTAPNAVGSAYRLGPEGTTFAVPVTLTFHAGAAIDVARLAIAYRDPGTGYWLRPANVSRDRTARTVSITTSHFSDWSLVGTPTSQDLNGSFTLQQTIGIPFTAKGNGTLNYAGENVDEIFYLLPGTLTVDSPITTSTASCTPDIPTFTLPTMLAEVPKQIPAFQWGLNARWNLTCSNGMHPTLATEFDSYGINEVGCSRGYLGTPIFGRDRQQGTYKIDCGSNGIIQATWDFIGVNCGNSCAPSPCHVGYLSCDTGTATCVDTGTVPDGTSCGTGSVCYQGTCNGCVSGTACTTNPDPLCHDGVTDCSTGTQQCVNAAAKPDGTSCGNGQVCSAGSCVACAAGSDCTPGGACYESLTSCSTGTSVCQQTTTPIAAGVTCGTSQVCNGSGTCVSCTAGTDCTPAGACYVSTTSCATGSSVCQQTATPVTAGTACGSGLVCNGSGSCVSCTSGTECTPTGACYKSYTSCSTGASSCQPSSTPVAAGTYCGTDAVCNGSGGCVSCTAGTDCTPAGSCTRWQTSCATGTSQCVDTGTPIAAGTTCGASEVCNGSGSCVSCVSGVDCTAPGACMVSQTSCATGTSVCQQTATPVTAGTSCGNGTVCDGSGSCVAACVAGVDCTQQGACVTSQTTCSSPTAAPVCAQTTNPVPAGTSCGTGLVCDGSGSCIAACVAGVDCTPQGACMVSQTSCSTGTSVCEQTTTPVAVGTSCGTYQSCDGNGTCVCDTGVDCTPQGSCTVWQTSCATGTPVCTDTGTPVVPGTTCP